MERGQYLFDLWVKRGKYPEESVVISKVEKESYVGEAYAVEVSNKFGALSEEGGFSRQERE